MYSVFVFQLLQMKNALSNNEWERKRLSEGEHGS